MKQRARHTLPLREIADLRNGLNFKVSQVGDGVRVIGVSDIKHAVFRDYDALPQVAVPAMLPTDFARTGDILFVRSNGNRALVGRSTLLADVPPGVTHSGFTIRARPDITRVDARYLYYALNSKMARHAMRRLAGGSNISNISQEILGDIPIYLPSLSEQNAVVRSLEPFDNDLVLRSRLIAARHRFKRGLMHPLLTGKVRFNRFRSKQWRSTTIASLFEAVSRPIEWDAHATYDLLSVRRRSGGVFMRGRMPAERIATKTLFDVRPGDVLISKMQAVHGAIGLVKPEQDGMKVSGSYITLRPKPNARMTPAFFAWLTRLPQMYKAVLLSSHGVHIEKMTFSLDWYLRTRVSLPEDEAEQNRIVALLDALEHEENLLVALTAAIERQKHALLDQMLSGDLRLHIK